MKLLPSNNIRDYKTDVTKRFYYEVCLFAASDIKLMKQNRRDYLDTLQCVLETCEDFKRHQTFVFCVFCRIIEVSVINCFCDC